jgi:hypothetical protein
MILMEGWVVIGGGGGRRGSAGQKASWSESIERFIEDQAFSPSYDLAPLPPYPLSRQQVVSLSQSSCVPCLLRGELGQGEGGGEAKSYDGEKAWSPINR